VTEGNTVMDRESLETLERMKANFIANISHELGTPLASIKGFTSTLLSEENMDRNTQRRFLKIIEEETDNLTKLINRVINTTKYEQLDIKSGFKEFNIVSTIKEVLKSFDTELRVNNVRISVNAPLEINVTASMDGLREALVQIIGNAIKFSENGGAVSVEVTEKMTDVQVSVSDNGCGIAADDLPYIFDKFYKVEHPLKQMGGIGVGLSLAGKIIEQHKGKLWAESPVPGGKDKGTRVSFMIPKKT
jgi:two-component system phosphate regulon sensor histidine kinase PhoR